MENDELNALIAERLFGYRWFSANIDGEIRSCLFQPVQQGYLRDESLDWKECPKPVGLVMFYGPDFCNDAAALAMLKEELKRREHSFATQWSEIIITGWHAWIQETARSKGYRRFNAMGQTENQALCLAVKELIESEK